MLSSYLSRAAKSMNWLSQPKDSKSYFPIIGVVISSDITFQIMSFRIRPVTCLVFIKTFILTVQEHVRHMFSVTSRYTWLLLSGLVVTFGWHFFICVNNCLDMKPASAPRSASRSTSVDPLAKSALIMVVWTDVDGCVTPAARPVFLLFFSCHALTFSLLFYQLHPCFFVWSLTVDKKMPFYLLSIQWI